MMRAALLPLLALLAACGFQPLYATNEAGEGLGADLRAVQVAEVLGPPDASYYLQNAIAETLPGDAPARYRLGVSLREQQRAIAVTRSAESTRFEYVLNARYTIVDLETGDRRTQRLQAVTSYGVVESQFASLVGQEDAVRRAALELSRRLETDLALYIKGRAPKASALPEAPGIDGAVDGDLTPELDEVTDFPAGAPAGSRPQ